MKKKDVYSKENLESFVYDLLVYLYKTKVENGSNDEVRLSEDIYICSMNKCYSIDEEKPSIVIKNTPIRIEDNVNVADYFEYYNENTLTLAMDSILCDYLYYYDVPGCEEIADTVFGIFEKHGFHHDFGNSTTVYAWTKDNHPYADI